MDQLEVCVCDFKSPSQPGWRDTPSLLGRTGTDQTSR